MGILANIASL